MKKYLDIHTDVEEALCQGKPVVALESTIISHGMPYPQNVETARELERIIKDAGVVPATIAIIDGKLKVGLTDSELEFFGKAKNIAKVSRRDLPFIVSEKKHGATTVASTMIIAAMAGIKIFVTGGIGGVHRGAQETFDISADLMELSRTNVAVVCAGAKSILDIGLTLEYLETQGVPVIGFQTKDFPAFYTQKSGFHVDFQANNAAAVAEAVHAKWTLGLDGGVVVANPIPDSHAMNSDIIDKAIETALEEAKSKQIIGKETTPFLLAKIKELTEGKSLASNIALVYNNARLGAEIANALAHIA